MDKRGYYKKYNITRVDGLPIDAWTFVLEEHDPLAIPALRAYAEASAEAGNETLAADLRVKVRELEAKIEGT